jgi:hypothetical protein
MSLIVFAGASQLSETVITVVPVSAAIPPESPAGTARPAARIAATMAAAPAAPTSRICTVGRRGAGSIAGCGAGTKTGQELGGPDLYFDPCAFAVPAPGMLGNLGRNTIVSARVVNLDLSLQREFLLDQKRRLQFQAEFFNAPNHTNFGKPSATVFTGATGRLSSTAGKIRSTATTPRQIQLALRFSF